MEICSWNIWGFSDPVKQRGLKDLINIYEPTMLALVEVKLHQNKADRAKMRIWTRLVIDLPLRLMRMRKFEYGCFGTVMS